MKKSKWVALILVLVLCFQSSVFAADTWICDNCQRENNTNFCPVCGIAKPEENWKCVNCGAENEADFKFCTNCGTEKTTGSAVRAEGETVASPASSIE